MSAPVGHPSGTSQAPPLVLDALWNALWHLLTATPWTALALGLLVLAKIWHDVYLVVPVETTATAREPLRR